MPSHAKVDMKLTQQQQQQQHYYYFYALDIKDPEEFGKKIRRRLS